MGSGVTEAVLFGSRDALSDALAAGGNPDETENGITALTLACIQNREDLVRELLRYHADFKVRDADGATVLHTAAGIGSGAIVKLLLDRGADKESRTSVGQTPLMAAAHSGDEETVRTLLTAGADAKRTDDYGRNALHWAAIGGDQVAVFFALIEAGADVDVSTTDGKSSIDYAAELGRFELMNLIHSRFPQKSDQFQ
jgi:ankyrin repeat protein